MNFELNAKPKIQPLSILMSSKWGLIHYLEMLHFLFGKIPLKSSCSKFLKKIFFRCFWFISVFRHGQTLICWIHIKYRKVEVPWKRVLCCCSGFCSLCQAVERSKIEVAASAEKLLVLVCPRHGKPPIWRQKLKWDIFHFMILSVKKVLLISI